jgi:hypothetical protein
MRQDDFIGQAFYWFTAVVEDIADPEKMNRVKVRCHGYHDEDTAKLKTADLPWAIVMMPNTSQASKGYGRTHELEVGSWVVGFFRDGSSSQDPLVMGSVSTQSPAESEFGFPTNDLPLEASSADNYPNNKVYKSMAGHTVEFDNGVWNKAIARVEPVSAVTGGVALDGTVIEAVDAVEEVTAVAANRTGETIRVTHAKGAVITIDEDNNISITNDGTSTITTTGNISVISTEGDIGVTATEGNVNVTSSAKEVKITAIGDITLSSATKTRVM